MQASTQFSQRALVWAFTALLALGVAGCGSEAKERKTFIDFLQTRIVDKAGLHVPRPTPEEEKSFGEYSKHFAVIRDFNGAMDSKVTAPMRTMLEKGMPRSIPDLVARRADLAAVRATSVLLRTSIETELAKADAQRAALKQPDDLKVVYDKAYARTVKDPAIMIRDFMPAVEATLLSAEKMAEFLEAHKDQIKFNGPMLEVTDPTLMEEANALMKQMGVRSNEVMAAQQKMNAMMAGH